MNPQHDGAWYNKGTVLLELENYEDSLTCFNKSIMINSNCSNCWHNKGVLFEELERDEEAEQCFAKVKELQQS